MDLDCNGPEFCISYNFGAQITLAIGMMIILYLESFLAVYNQIPFLFPGFMGLLTTTIIRTTIGERLTYNKCSNEFLQIDVKEVNNLTVINNQEAKLKKV